MSSAVSLVDLLLFHTFEINLYKRLVGNLGRTHEVAKTLIALWLWLESIGHLEFIRTITSFADSALEAVVAEAEAAIKCLGGEVPPTTGHNDMPITSGLLNEPLNLRFFIYNHEVANQGINYTLNTVCNVIFPLGVGGCPTSQSHTAGVAMRPSGEGSSTQGDLLGSTWSQQSTLNPFARPWAPALAPTSQDQRSMFLTFSKGFPFTRDEIFAFFTMNWGNCVDKVMVERAPHGQQPMFGRVVFTNASTIPLILNGQRTAKFTVNGKQLWARIYVPRRNN